MIQYHNLLKHILKNGVDRDDRTGTGTRSIFGHQMRFDLNEGFPLITTKKLHIPSIVHELLWFLKGSRNTQYLNDNGITIWDEWADATGDLGPIYGVQWRSWDTSLFKDPVDQIEKVISDIKTDPTSRRLIVSAWNVSDLEDMALQPCHVMFQFYVANGRLSCQLYQRSADVFLGLPFNIASYALLTHMIAQVTKLEVGEFIHTIGDAHLYHNHLDQAQEQLKRGVLLLPTLKLNPHIAFIDDFTFNDIEFVNYHAHPHIKAPVAI